MLFSNSVLSEGVQTEPEDFRPPKLYNLLPILNIKKAQLRPKVFSNQRERSYKIANARNPFSRLYSAWHDKARTHLFPNKSVDYSSFTWLNDDHKIFPSVVENELKDHAQHFHIPYYPGIKPFETTKPPDGMNYSFPARV